MTLAAGTTLQNDRYVIQAVLNQSDFGVTYAAIHAETNQVVLVQTLNEVVRQRSDFADLHRQFLLGVDRCLPDQEPIAELGETREASPQRWGKVLDCFQEADLPFVVWQFVVWQMDQQAESLPSSFKVSDWLQLPVEITDTALTGESVSAVTSELTSELTSAVTSELTSEQADESSRESIQESIQESIEQSELAQSNHQTILPVNRAIATPANDAIPLPLNFNGSVTQPAEFANVDLNVNLLAQSPSAAADEPVTQVPFTGFSATGFSATEFPATEFPATESPTLLTLEPNGIEQHGNELQSHPSAIATQVAVRRAPLPAIVRPQPERLFPIALSVTSVVVGFLATGFVLSVRLAPERAAQSADGQPALSSNFLFNRDQSFSAQGDWPITDTSSVFLPTSEPTLQEPMYRTVTPIEGTQPNGTAGDTWMQNSAIQQPSSPDVPAIDYNYGLEAVPRDRSLPRSSSPRLAPAPRSPVPAPQPRIADPAPFLEDLQPSTAPAAAPEPEPLSPPAADPDPAIANPAITTEPEMAPPAPPPAPEAPAAAPADAVSQ